MTGVQTCALPISKFGFSVIDSDANFLLFKGFKAEAKDIWQALLDDGILIRDVGLTEFLRVTIGTPSENDKFLTAIAKHRP